MTRPGPADLFGDVWCLTCQHPHIPQIPTVTFACALCGFAVWDVDHAGRHATEYPDHVVYAVHHQTVPLEDRERAEAVADVIAPHDGYRVDDDGWTVCLCGHVAEGDDDDGSHARHLADVLTAECRPCP